MNRVFERLARSVAVAAVLTVATATSAQVTTGTVSGSVKDAQGGVVPGATAELTSTTRATTLPTVVTDGSGSFTFVNVAPDSYRLRVSLAGFKAVQREGVTVSPGDRLSIPVTLEVGGASETLTVTAEAGLIQANSGERSFSVGAAAVANLPIQNRSFTQLAALAPGVTVDANNTPQRVGGGGSTNILLDGVAANDTGSNRPIMQVNVESIAEVKILTSGYQAEYGRNSGVQVTAVTKGGTNRFHGSLYDVERNSKWNANSKTNILNRDPKVVSKQRDWGFTLGGPVGKPGGANKIFFFFAQEFEPRRAGGDTFRYRVPTALERAGDFSQTYDQNGALYALIKDPNSTAACTAANTAGCFSSGGVLGRIPTARLYQPGLNILNSYPLPTITGTAAAGLNYNYEVTRPTEKAMAYQPAIRLDYQASASLRGTFKYTGWGQQNPIFLGTIPGYNDTKMYKPKIVTYATTLNYTATSSTFIEFTFGHARNDLSGCALAQSGTGPVFCTSGAAGGPAPGGFMMNPNANRLTAGFGNLPTLFDASTMFNVDPSFYSYEQLASVAPPSFVNGQMLQSPSFVFGGRVTGNAPSQLYPSFVNMNSTYDVSGSVTHVRGRHTLKAGYYQTLAVKQQNPNGTGNVFGVLTFTNDTANPLDTSFPYANAAVGVVGTYAQNSRLIEAKMIAWNVEWYLQDNWKLNNRLTLDYGMRFVHQTPMYDDNGFASTFLPSKYNIASAPSLYIAGCSNGVATCAGTTRQARNPLTGQLAGAGSAVLIGTMVPNSGTVLNGIAQAGQGVPNTIHTWPSIGYAPRFGAAFDVTGQQKIVLRGGLGLYFDRPAGNAVLAQVTNPPVLQNATIRNAQLQNIGSGAAGFSPVSASALNVFQVDMGLPSSTQWNAGVQLALPWASSLDVSYVGQHAWNQLVGVNINAVDAGAAFLAANQDSTLSSTTPGANALPTDNLRAIRGFGAITMQQPISWNTFHSLQFSFQRRFSKGISFGFNDAMSLKNENFQPLRLQHAADGSYSVRADQQQAQDLLNPDPVRHTLKANFVWDLPDFHGNRVVGAVLNDWQLSGIWTGTTAAPYTVGYSITGINALNLSGSADFAPRINITGDPGSGCNNANPLRQFNTAAFSGPAVNTSGAGIGLESSPNAVKGCFQSALDLAVARTVRLGGGRTIQVRVDVLNAPNQAIVTGRNVTMNIAGLTSISTATNLPFDANGDVIATRSQPKNAGFGVANAYQTPRTIQIQLRFGF